MCGGIVGSASSGSTPAPRLTMSLRLGSAAISPGGGFQTSAVSIPAGSPSSGETRISSSGISADSAADHATGSSRRLENNRAPAILVSRIARASRFRHIGASCAIPRRFPWRRHDPDPDPARPSRRDARPVRRASRRPGGARRLCANPRHQPGPRRGRGGRARPSGRPRLGASARRSDPSATAPIAPSTGTARRSTPPPRPM